VNVSAAFPADVATLARTRRFVGSVLSGTAATADQVDAAVLVTNELAANAVCHAGDHDLVVRLRCSDRDLRIEVDDRGGDLELAEPAADRPLWSGLRLVEALSGRWGVEQTRSGKRLWALLQLG
jgi:anti-sigma regulatory factor (Ser/Thr protein kinase)